MKTKRDLSIIDIGEDRSLVIACDVSGGIGSKSKDSLQVEGEVVGYVTSRVALMEILAVGAKPISIIDTLSVEYDPAGREIIRGIEKTINEIGIDSSILNGSTEDNIETYETGVGITVIGIIGNDNLKINSSYKGDVLVAIGIPLVGEEVLKNKNMIAELVDLENLRKKSYVKEILPVGSKGIKYEAELMAKMSEINIVYDKGLDLNLEKSAGPATVVLASLAKKDVLQLREDFAHKPVNLIGRFV